MYYLVLELPFNLVAVWHRHFETEQEAIDYSTTLPFGFVVTDTVPENAITVPME